jgi:hypothetical protein
MVPVKLTKWVFSVFKPFSPNGLPSANTIKLLAMSLPKWLKCGGMGYVRPRKSRLCGNQMILSRYLKKPKETQPILMPSKIEEQPKQNTAFVFPDVLVNNFCQRFEPLAKIITLAFHFSQKSEEKQIHIPCLLSITYTIPCTTIRTCPLWFLFFPLFPVKF